MASHYCKPVWRMIKEAVRALGGRAARAEIVRRVLREYPGTNPNTVQTQIGYCTVNMPSRIHSPENKRPMIADREKDCLFTTERGQFELYDPAHHGVWAIAIAGSGALCVRRTVGMGGDAEATEGRPCSSPRTALPARPFARRRTGAYSNRIFAPNYEELVARIDHYYPESLGIWRTFGGPSVYFHRKAIAAAREEFLSVRHVEYIYATLPAWGMHRMGDRSAKMTEFADFQASVMANRDRLTRLQGIALESLSDTALRDLLEGDIRVVFEGLSVSVSDDVKLVANTKALHHMLPALVPPVDRQHTMRFFYQPPEEFRYTNRRGRRKWRGVGFPESVDDQYQILRTICSKTREILVMPQFRTIAAVDAPAALFNTSLPKIVDNMIIAFVKEKGR